MWAQNTCLPYLAVCQTRQIKVNQHIYLHPHRDDPNNRGRAVPWLQMKGPWLKQAGFEIDTPVTVRVMDGCLVLTTQPREAAS